MGCSAVGGGKGIGPAGKHQPSGNVVRQSPTMRLASPQAHPQGRWGSASAALRRREKTTGSIGVYGIGMGPWARNSSMDGFAQMLHHFQWWQSVHELALRECPDSHDLVGTGRRGAAPLMTDHEHPSGIFGTDAPGLGYG